MSNRTWTLKIDENELRWLIQAHSIKHACDIHGFNVESSARIHDLTKRLNKKDEVEIEQASDSQAISEGSNEAKSNPIPQQWGNSNG
jgi:hypothetical protein